MYFFSCYSNGKFILSVTCVLLVVLVPFLTIVTKYSDNNDLRKEEFLWLMIYGRSWQ